METLIRASPADVGPYHPAVDAHTAEFLLASAEEARQALRGPDGTAAQAQLEELYPDLRTAFEFFLAAGQSEDALRLSQALVPFWMATSRIDEGDAWFQHAVQAPGSTHAARARGLYDHGYLIFWSGDYGRSGELARQAVELGRAADQPTTVALALGVLSRIALKADLDDRSRSAGAGMSIAEGVSFALSESAAIAPVD
jgi:hypothetical protein